MGRGIKNVHNYLTFLIYYAISQYTPSEFSYPPPPGQRSAFLNGKWNSMEWNGIEWNGMGMESYEIQKFSKWKFHTTNLEFLFHFHFHSIPFPLPNINIIVCHNLSIPSPFRFHTIQFNFTSMVRWLFTSISFPFCFRSISLPFCINLFCSKISIPFPFHHRPLL